MLGKEKQPMKILLVLLMLLGWNRALDAQQHEEKTYYSLVEALEEPTKVHSLYLNSPSSIDSTLWDSLYQLVHLKSLHLGFDRKFKKLPSGLFQLYSLEELHISGASLDTIPAAIQQLQQLQKITIENGSLAYYPASINQLKNLIYLELHHIYKAQTLPKSIGQLKNLRELSISASPLSELPNSIAELRQLEVLSLAKNKFTTFPVVINQLKALKKLDLHYNELVGLPVFSPKLKHLEFIDLSYNDLPHFPVSLVQLPALKEVNIAGNPIQFPASLGAHHSPISSINASYCNLQTFPTALASLKQLERLNLKINKISLLPKTIVPFEQLKLLDMSRCKLEVIEAGVYFGPQLQELHLLLNEIQELPASILQSPQLQKLDASFCFLTALPQGLEQLDSLQLADFKYNQLQQIPVALKKQLGKKLITVGNPFTLAKEHKMQAIAATKATFTDPRDGQTYATVTINGSTWMAEHLNYKTDSSLPDTLLPNNGRLYLLQEYQKVCPAGWHTATTQDWKHLVKVVYHYFELDPNAEVNERIASTRRPYGISYEDPVIIFDPFQVKSSEFGNIGPYFVNEQFTEGVLKTPHANFLGLNIASKQFNRPQRRAIPISSGVAFPTLNREGKWNSWIINCLGSFSEVTLLESFQPRKGAYYHLRCVEDGV